MFKVNNKDTSVSTVNFKKANADWEAACQIETSFIVYDFFSDSRNKVASACVDIHMLVIRDPNQKGFNTDDNQIDFSEAATILQTKIFKYFTNKMKSFGYLFDSNSFKNFLYCFNKIIESKLKEIREETKEKE